MSRWLGWAALMAATGLAAAWLHGRLEPLIPGGEWHGLLSNISVVLLWPSLMWPLYTIAGRFCPRYFGKLNT